jgi:hypothetical protein
LVGRLTHKPHRGLLGLARVVKGAREGLGLGVGPMGAMGEQEGLAMVPMGVQEGMEALEGSRLLLQLLLLT